MQNWRYRLTSQSSAAVIFAYRYRPAWLILPIVFLFPLGLLFLLYSRTVEISFNFVPAGTGTEVSVTGQGPPYVRNRIGQILETLQDTREKAGI
jgi:hypothetical protein